MKRPDNPLDFLIESLMTKRKQRLIFVIGYAKGFVNAIVSDLAAQLNFKHVSYFDFVKKEIE